MRISDWSSDVCSSDLLQPIGGPTAGGGIVDTRQRLERDRAAAQVVMLAAQAEDGRTDRTPGVEHEYPRSGIAPELQHQHGQQPRLAGAGRPRSGERRVGNECVSTCSTWWSTDPYTKK